MMGLTRRRRKGRREEDRIDLLTTAFNLPNRHTLERDERRRALKNQQRIVVVRRTPDDDYDDDTSESESETALESQPETESVDSSSEEEELTCKKTPRTPRRKARQASPPPTPVKTSRKSHRRLHSEPQNQCLKLVEAELARVPATEPRPSRKERRREKKLRDKEHKKASRKSGSPEGSPTPWTTTPAPPKTKDSEAGFVRGPSSGTLPFFQPPMAATMPPHHAMYYQQPQMAFNQGPHVAHGQDPRLAGPQGILQQAYLANAHHSTVPYPFNMSGTRAPPMPMSKSQELQRVQQDLDEATAALNVSPHEMGLQARAAALRNLLNSTLNEAMGQNHMSEPTGPSHGRVHKHQKMCADDTSVQKEQEIVTKDKNHHVCDGCGSLRSRRYHEMRPLAPGKAKRDSLCESCREAYHKVGVMGDQSQHICFGCGVFRSEGFNKRNFLGPGKPLLANFCARCQIDVRDADDSSSSVIGTDIKAAKPKTRATNREQKIPLGDETSEHHSDKRRSEAPEPSQHSIETETETPRGSPGDPCMVSPLSPHSQAISDGRSERRGRRNTPAHESNPVRAPSEPAHQYQPPFVEDVTTPLQNKAAAAAATSKLSSILRENKDSFSSQGSSDVSPPSGTSGKSSGNKNVKFKDHVGVRHSRSPSSSGLSSGGKVEEAIKPDDDSIPKRAGDFGDTPVRDSFGNPVFTPEYYARRRESYGSPSDTGRYSAPNDGSPDRHWDHQPLEPPTGFNRGAFANMASGGLESHGPGLSAKWRDCEKPVWPASYDQGTYEDLNGGFDGASEDISPKSFRPRRRSVFASFLDGASEDYRDPNSPSSFHPTSSGSYGQAHPETAGDS